MLKSNSEEILQKTKTLIQVNKVETEEKINESTLMIEHSISSLELKLTHMIEELGMNLRKEI